MARVLPLSTDGDTAGLWDGFVVRHVGRRSCADLALREVIDADPGLAVAHAAALLLALVGAGDFDTGEQAAAARRGRTDHDWERSFVEATLTMHSQGLWPSRPSWVRHQQRFPADLVGLVLTVFLAATSTEPDAQEQVLGMSRSAGRSVGEHPLLLGYEAMVAQDRGRLDDAHRLAARALELDPTGFDGGHPMAHVFSRAATTTAASPGSTAGSRGPTRTHRSVATWSGTRRSTTSRWATASAPWSATSTAGADPAPVPSSTAARCCGAASSTVSCGRATTPRAPPSCRWSRHWSPGSRPPSSGCMSRSGWPRPTTPRACAATPASAASFTAPGAAELLPGLARGLAAYVEDDHVAASELLLGEEQRVARYGGSHAQREVFGDTLLQSLVRAERYDEATTRLRSRLDRRESRLDAGLLAHVGAAG